VPTKGEIVPAISRPPSSRTKKIASTLRVERRHNCCSPWCIASLSAILPLLLLFVDGGVGNRSRRRNRRSTTSAFPNTLLHSRLYAPMRGRPPTNSSGGTLAGTVPYGMEIAIHTGIPTVLMATICRLFQRCLARQCPWFQKNKERTVPEGST
jgi:hypothetical protein